MQLSVSSKSIFLVIKLQDCGRYVTYVGLSGSFSENLLQKTLLTAQKIR